MSKWVLWCFLCFTVFTAVLGKQETGFAQEKKILVFVDGSIVEFDAQPIVQDGRTLVPFRTIAEVLGAEVSWESTSRTIIATHHGSKIILQIGNNIAWLNGNPVLLDVSPALMAGRTLIPLRFFSESLEADVQWDGTSRTIKIISPPSSMKVIGFYTLGSLQHGTSSWENLFGAPFPNKNGGYSDLVDQLALGWYVLDDEGNLLKNSSTGWKRPDGWENVLEAAKEEQMGMEMVVHLPDRDATMVNILKNEAATQKAILSIVEEAKRYYMGINLDIEGLGFKESSEQLKETQSLYTSFVRKLTAQAKEQGLDVTLTLHPPNSAYRGYDYRALGEIADSIIIMAYDYHIDRARKPEPLHKVKEAVVMALSQVPAEKLILGINAVNESSESVREKVGIAKRYKLQGIALWRLGMVKEELGEVLRQSIKARSE